MPGNIHGVDTINMMMAHTKTDTAKTFSGYYNPYMNSFSFPFYNKNLAKESLFEWANERYFGYVCSL